MKINSSNYIEQEEYTRHFVREFKEVVKVIDLRKKTFFCFTPSRKRCGYYSVGLREEDTNTIYKVVRQIYRYYGYRDVHVKNYGGTLYISLDGKDRKTLWDTLPEYRGSVSWYKVRL